MILIVHMYDLWTIIFATKYKLRNVPMLFGVEDELHDKGSHGDLYYCVPYSMAPHVSYATKQMHGYKQSVSKHESPLLLMSSPSRFACAS